MPEEWENQIQDPQERKVFKALANPEWNFRTVTGISKDTGIQEAEVSAILAKYPDLIRFSPVPDDCGRELYTLRSRPVRTQERLAVSQRAISKSAR